MRDLTLDLETYSEADLPKTGAARYAEDPSFEILLLSYAFDDGPVTTVDMARGERYPEDFLSALQDPNVRKWAWNIRFERSCLAVVGLDSPPEQWDDDMVLAAECGLPMSLGGCGAALGLPEDAAKDKKGKQLIIKFSKPRRPTKKNPNTRLYPDDDPEEWDLYKSYNNQDVVAERNIHNLLKKWMYDEREHRALALDSQINERGVKIDLQLAKSAVMMGSRYKQELIARAVELTHMDNVNSVAQIKQWLLEQEGIEVQSLGKKVIADVITSMKSDEAKEFLEIRKNLAKSSTAKYDTMLRSVCRNGNVKGCFQFYGASTGRWAGRQLQLQNLPQNHMPDLDDARELVRRGDYEGVRCIYGTVSSTLSELIRTALIPEEGSRWIVCDFSAIEARAIAFLAGEQWVLEEFRGDGLIYEATASMMFGVDKQLIRKGGPRVDLRQKGKIAQLACGYGGSIGAMKAFGADKMGLSDEEILDIVDRWRKANPNVVKLWYDIEKAAVKCIVRGYETHSQMCDVTYTLEDGTLFCKLPSGRRIAYREPKYEETAAYPGRKNITYMTQDQTTRKWKRVESRGPKLCENICQAFCRDVLLEKMFRLNSLGYDIRAHVHDELIMSEPYNSGHSLEQVKAVFAEPVAFAPEMPLRGDGYECNYYMKD